MEQITKEGNQPLEITPNDLVQALDNAMTQELQDQGAHLMRKVNELTIQTNIQFKPTATSNSNQQQPKVEEYKDVTVTITQAEEVSLQIYKTLPEFNEDRDKNLTWRSSTQTAMNLLSGDAVLQQNKMTIDEFYDKVNEKLNVIDNKVIMTYKDVSTAKAFVKSSNEKALRIINE